MRLYGIDVVYIFVDIDMFTGIGGLVVKLGSFVVYIFVRG